MTDSPAVIFINDPRRVSLNKGVRVERLNYPILVPLKKKLKIEKLEDDGEKSHESLKTLLITFNKEITKKLESIEARVNCLAESYDILEQKVESLSSAVEEQSETLRLTVANQEDFEEGLGIQIGLNPFPRTIPISSRITYIKLNKEEDFPNGSWLGDPDNTQCRVRCHISPTEMFHIHTTCGTAEKMALTLLDRLFDRETQARSNISGMGKHKKQQLNPLYIYGMKCHIKFHFSVTERDWNRIKQNLDSKCRTAFRRKIKGLPLTPKVASIDSPPAPPCQQLDPKLEEEEMPFDSVSQSSMDNELGGGHGEGEEDPMAPFHEMHPEGEEVNILERAMKEATGDFEVLHATPQEVARIQQSHQIRLFYCEDNLLLPMKAPQDVGSSRHSDSAYEDNS